MTIDERLEALAQSVELLASFHRDTEAAMRATDARIEKLLGSIATLTGHMGTLAGHMVTIAQAVNQHQQRIDRLEGK